MEGGDKDLIPNKKENESLRKEKDKLVQITLSAMKWYGAWSPDQKQYLPDSAIIPLVKYEKGKHWAGPANGAPELISVQKLRGDSLFTPAKTEVSDVYWERPEFIDIPWSFVKEGSYIVLMVPLVGSEGIEYYNITVLKCLSDRKLLKLMSSLEHAHREEFNEFNKEKLSLPKKGRAGGENLSDSYCDLETLVKDDQSDTLNIWMGFSDSNEGLQKRKVNGTICYRMVEGKAERKKSEDPKRVLKLVPQTVNQI